MTGYTAHCTATECDDAELTDQQIIDLICAFALHCGLDCDEALEALDLSLDDAATPEKDRALLVCLGCMPSSSMPAANTPPGERSDGANPSGVAGSKGCKTNALTTDEPVYLPHRIKVENVTDVTVELPGRDFEIVRSYTSDPGYTGSSLAGEHWSLSCFKFLSFPSGLDLSNMPINIALHGASPTSRGYCESASGGGWAPNGSGTWSVASASAVVDGITYQVLRVSEPGQYEIDFVRTAPGGAPHSTALLQGLPIQERDSYGNQWTYSYGAYGSPQVLRLEAIYLNGESRADAKAVVQFRWNTDVAVPGAYGKVDTVQVLRKNSASNWVETDRVEYLYKEGSVDHLGTEGDLIQVSNRTSVDTVPLGQRLRTQITQYRYHDGTVTTAPTDDDDRVQILGADHQLKLVIEPEQVEFFAQKANASWAVGGHAAIDAGAAALLTKLDSATLFTHESIPYSTRDIASKILSYTGTSDSPITTQYLQTGCGGSGGTQGLKLVYEEFGASGYPTTRITQLRYDGGPTSSDDYEGDHVSTCYDMVEIDDIFYLVNKAIFESGGSRLWVWHYIYDSDGLLIKEMMPSAKASYTAATSIAASYTASTTTGLVHAYVYTADKRLNEFRLSELGSNSGSDDTTVSTSFFTLVERGWTRAGPDVGAGVTPWTDDYSNLLGTLYELED